MIPGSTMGPAPDPVMTWQTALAIGLAAGVLLGLGLYYAIDRVKVLTGHTYRDLRHAGWAAARRPICGVLIPGGDICGEPAPCRAHPVGRIRRQP